MVRSLVFTVSGEHKPRKLRFPTGSLLTISQINALAITRPTQVVLHIPGFDAELDREYVLATLTSKAPCVKLNTRLMMEDAKVSLRGWNAEPAASGQGPVVQVSAAVVIPTEVDENALY